MGHRANLRVWWQIAQSGRAVNSHHGRVRKGYGRSPAAARRCRRCRTRPPQVLDVAGATCPQRGR
eukprot:887467-Prymnesium_polylepis.1